MGRPRCSSLQTGIVSHDSTVNDEQVIFVNCDYRLHMIMSSDWWYTQQIMEHLLGPSWLSLFHLVIVDAAKPRFFSPSENRKITKLDIVGGTPIYSGGSVVSWLFYMIMTLIGL